MTFPALSSLDTIMEWVSFATAKGAFRSKHVHNNTLEDSFVGSPENLVMLAMPLTLPSGRREFSPCEAYSKVALVSYWAAKAVAFWDSIAPIWER